MQLRNTSPIVVGDSNEKECSRGANMKWMMVPRAHQATKGSFLTFHQTDNASKFAS